MAHSRIRGRASTDQFGLNGSSDRMRMEGFTGPPQCTRNQLTNHHHVSTSYFLRGYDVEFVTGTPLHHPAVAPTVGVIVNQAAKAAITIESRKRPWLSP
jgi:hypothetical protein